MLDISRRMPRVSVAQHDAMIRRIDGDILHRLPTMDQCHWAGGAGFRIARGSVSGRAVVDRRTIHIR